MCVCVFVLGKVISTKIYDGQQSLRNRKQTVTARLAYVGEFGELEQEGHHPELHQIFGGSILELWDLLISVY